jgi:hypothetical protein
MASVLLPQKKKSTVGNITASVLLIYGPALVRSDEKISRPIPSGALITTSKSARAMHVLIDMH